MEEHGGSGKRYDQQAGSDWRGEIVGGIGFALEDVLVVVLGIGPNVEDPTIVRSSKLSYEDVELDC